jgi:hypothetical protein
MKPCTAKGVGFYILPDISGIKNAPDFRSQYLKKIKIRNQKKRKLRHYFYKAI